MKELISGIIMASGYSRRMGTDKLLLPVEGIPAVQRVLAAICGSAVDEVILVYHDEKIREIGEALGVKTIYNPSPELGQSQSIRIGLQTASADSDGYMFFVGDQPFISSGIINRLIAAFTSTGAPAAVPLFNGRRGNPVLFSAALKDELLDLKGDAGGRVILDRLNEGIEWVNIEDERAGLDMDTLEDYRKIQELEREI